MSGHWGGSNNNQKKRARDNGRWGAYYKNKNANKKDRYVEFDSSTSRAINSGQQPTLARKRRQLAQDNKKWGDNNNSNYETTSNQRAQDIFQDLIANHEENKSFSSITKGIKANPMLINTRKKFWRRKLSNLSTKDYDTAWKEGRNMFLKFINSKENGTVTPRFPPSDPAKLKDRGAQKNPPPGTSQKSKAAVDDSKTKKAKKNTDRNPGAKSSTSTTKKSKPTLDVIDLCDSDSDNDNRNGSQRKEQVPATGIDNNSKQVLTKTEAGISELNPPLPDVDPTTTSPPVEQENLNASTTEPTVTKKKSVANRWSNLFLGPNFRTDHIFSLDNGTI